MGPIGPWIVDCALRGRLRQQFKLHDRYRALAMRSAQAVRAGVAAADDDDLFALGRDELIVRNHVAFAAFVLQREVVHREMDAVELAPGDRQIARKRGSAGQQERVIVLSQLFNGDIRPYVGIRLEPDPFGGHDVEPAIEDGFLHLELRNPVAQEPADSVGALEYGDPVAGLIQLGCGCKPRGSGTHHGDFLPGSYRRRRSLHPAVLECFFDNRDFDLFDRHRICIDTENAGAFTRCRAYSTGELGKVVGRMEALNRFTPATPVNKVVPVGNDVSQRTTLVAEGNPTIHASRCLDLQLVFREVLVDLLPVVDPFCNGTTLRCYAWKFDEALWVTHFYRPACILAAASAAAALRTRRYSIGIIFRNLSRYRFHSLRIFPARVL